MSGGVYTLVGEARTNEQVRTGITKLPSTTFDYTQMIPSSLDCRTPQLCTTGSVHPSL